MSDITAEVTTLPKLLDRVAIKSDQDGIRVTLVGLDARIHANAVQCMMQAEKHGDTSLFVRLVTDIVDAKSGYRRQGILAWMKEFSPMRLDGQVIKLTGMKDGARQPFRCDLAHKTPFTELASAREMVPLRPVFRDGLVQKMDRAIKEYRAAIENTLIVPGEEPKPKALGKPFYNGNQADKVEAIIDDINAKLQELSAWQDKSKDIFTAKQAIAQATLEMSLNEPEPEPQSEAPEVPSVGDEQSVKTDETVN